MSGSKAPLFNGYKPGGYLARLRIGSTPTGIAFNFARNMKRKSFVNFCRKDNRF